MMNDKFVLECVDHEFINEIDLNRLKLHSSSSINRLHK